MESKGKFIVIEGMSGSGKSRQSSLLKAEFPDYFFDYEPSDELYGEVIHSIIEGQKLSDNVLEKCLYFGDEKFEFWKNMHEIIRRVQSAQKLSELEVQMLYMADRIYNLENKYIPRLKSGQSIILDRYFYSTIAYGYSGDVDMDKLWNIQKDAFVSSETAEKYWKPNMLIIFDVPAELAIKRLQSSGKVMDIFEKLERLKKIRTGYKLLAERTDLAENIVMINADQPAEEVFKIVKKELDKLKQFLN